MERDDGGDRGNHSHDTGNRRKQRSTSVEWGGAMWQGRLVSIWGVEDVENSLSPSSPPNATGGSAAEVSSARACGP